MLLVTAGGFTRRVVVTICYTLFVFLSIAIVALPPLTTISISQ